MIECNNVSYKYDKYMALSKVSLQLENGVYGLIGENGAGKSTLIKMLVGQNMPTTGTVLVDGSEMKRESLNTGYLPQYFDFFHNLKVLEALEYVGMLKGISEGQIRDEALYWIKQVGLFNECEKKVSALSGGMRQRLGIAQAFLGNPDCIILDEPTVGLDPRERLAFRNMVNELGTNKMIMIATHIIEDVGSTCERIIVLSKGKVLFQGFTKDFIGSIQEKIYTIIIPREKIGEYSEKLNIVSIKLLGNELEIRFVGDNYINSEKCKEQQCTLEDAYFIMTGLVYKKDGSDDDKAVLEMQTD